MLLAGVLAAVLAAVLAGGGIGGSIGGGIGVVVLSLRDLSQTCVVAVERK